MLFTRKPEKTFITEYENVLKRLVEIEQRVNGLEIENKMLRDKVLRKIQRLADSEEIEPLTPKSSNTPVFSPFR